jgi:hypothetical protein
MEPATKEEATTIKRDVNSPASAGELCAGADGSIVKDEQVEGTHPPISADAPKSVSSVSPAHNLDHAPGEKSPHDGVAEKTEKSLVSGREQWTNWRESAAQRPIQALWHLCDECLLNLNRENRRLHMDSSSEPDLPLMLTFTSETPVSMDLTDRGTLFRRASVALSDVTVLLARNFEEFELTLFCRDLQSESEAVIKAPRWSFEELEDFTPALHLVALKHSAIARVLASVAGRVSSRDLMDAADEGIRVLLRQLERMSCDPWAASSHVGCFLFHTIAHHGGNADWLSLERIRSLMPTVFLNIQPDIDLRVGGREVSSGYYNNCLAELSRFTAVVDLATGLWKPMDSADADGTPTLDDTERLLHVFIGFDALRCMSDEKRNTSLVLCFLGEMGLMNNVELKQLDPVVGCGLTLLVYAPDAPTTRNVSKFYYAEDTKRDNSFFSGALSEIARSVGTGFLSHHWVESCQSMQCLVRRIQSLAGRVYRAVNGGSSIADPLPRCTVTTFGNWKYQPETKRFTDGYIVEVGLDTLHHLPPAGSFADADERHPKKATDQQGISHASGQNPTRCPESYCERDFRTGRQSAGPIRAPPTLVTPSSKVPNPPASSEPSMRSASATDELRRSPQWQQQTFSQSPTATKMFQVGREQDRLEDDTPLLADGSVASLMEAVNKKLREKLAAAEKELKLYRDGLVNANEVAAMAKNHNASLISVNQGLITQVQELTASNQNLKRQAEHLMAENVSLRKRARVVSSDTPATNPHNAFAPPGSWPTEVEQDPCRAFSPHNFDRAGFNF